MSRKKKGHRKPGKGKGKGGNASKPHVNRGNFKSQSIVEQQEEKVNTKESKNKDVNKNNDSNEKPTQKVHKPSLIAVGIIDLILIAIAIYVLIFEPLTSLFGDKHSPIAQITNVGFGCFILVFTIISTSLPFLLMFSKTRPLAVFIMDKINIILDKMSWLVILFIPILVFSMVLLIGLLPYIIVTIMIALKFPSIDAAFYSTNLVALLIFSYVLPLFNKKLLDSFSLEGSKIRDLFKKLYDTIFDAKFARFFLYVIYVVIYFIWNIYDLSSLEDRGRILGEIIKILELLLPNYKEVFVTFIAIETAIAYFKNEVKQSNKQSYSSAKKEP